VAVNWNGQSVLERVRTAVQQEIVRQTEEVRNAAVSLIMDTLKTGRIYRRRGVEHRASAPDEAPASDTGRLVNSIRTDYRLAELTGIVSASTAYAAYLEYGTSRMAPRPYMRPALASRRAAIEAGLAAAARSALGGSK
jgi:HK97 gp10 family phage protein